MSVRRSQGLHTGAVRRSTGAEIAMPAPRRSAVQERMSDYEFQLRSQAAEDGYLYDDNRPQAMQLQAYAHEAALRNAAGTMSDYEFNRRNEAAIAGVLAGDPRPRQEQVVAYRREAMRRGRM